MPRRLVLASASPARARLLEQAGLAFEVMVSGVDESGADGQSPDALVVELARRKAGAVAALLGDERTDGIVVLGCDSMFVFDGVVHGKPASADAARQRWRAMRGHEGTLLTGHCVIDIASSASAEAVDACVVRFGDPTDAEVDAYVATAEPMAVAGGFTLDGLASPFVESVQGNPGTVIGLSLPLLRRLLAKLDVGITDLWR
jgi:septum formation protein